MPHISLVEFLRKHLMLSSQEPSLEEEADWYIKGLEACMREARNDVIAPSCSDPNRWRNEDWFASGKQNGFDLATKTSLNTLKGKTTE